MFGVGRDQVGRQDKVLRVSELSTVSKFVLYDFSPQVDLAVDSESPRLPRLDVGHPWVEVTVRAAGAFLVLLVTNVATCRAVAMPLLFAGLAAIGYALMFVALSSKTPTANEPTAGRAFDLRLALLFAVTITLILFLCASLNQGYGRSRSFSSGCAFRVRRYPCDGNFDRVAGLRRGLCT